ncbi:MAG: hypothetical protein Q9O62_05290 [Ardenticatenia bacterium]|nr:hypothetical protein [Ardenticatenia bacterium]
MTWRHLYNVFNIIREIDLEAVQQQAHRRFAILVTGCSDPDVLALARLVSGGAEVHPWLELQALPHRHQETWDLALLVVRGERLGDEEKAAREALHRAGVPVIVVLVGAPFTAEALPRRKEAARVRLLSTSDREGFERVLAPAILKVVPSLNLALGRHLWGLRSVVADQLIERTSRANAAYVFTTGIAETIPVLSAPLAVADVIVLTKNQLLMAYKLALVSGKEGRPRDIFVEVVGVIGGGLLFRQVARQLVGLVPGVGLMARAAVAYAGTWAIGRLVYTWATEGRRLSKAEMAQLTREASQRAREAVRQFWQRRREPLPGD